MKFKTFLVAATAGGIGYVLGTKAGRARFEEIRGQAQGFLKSPAVQDTVANLSETVKQNAAKLPDPVANVVSAAADKVKGSNAAGQSATDLSAPDSTGTDSMGTDSSMTTSAGPESTTAGATLSDTSVSDLSGTDTGYTDPTVPQSPPRTSSTQ